MYNYESDVGSEKKGRRLQRLIHKISPLTECLNRHEWADPAGSRVPLRVRVKKSTHCTPYCMCELDPDLVTAVPTITNASLLLETRILGVVRHSIAVCHFIGPRLFHLCTPVRAGFT